MTVLYPDGYGTRMVTLEEMEVRHGGKQHPEFARRFFAYMEHKGGALGVGGGWRSTQPDKPGFAPDGKSFHQDQRYASGFVGYAAVDLVHVNPGKVHRSPTWDECADAPTFGLHTFITGEPWHIQCVEMRGWQTWVNAGRPDPQTFTLPTDPEDDDMAKPEDCYIARPPAGSDPDKPWFVVEKFGGGVRYAMNEDAANPAIKQVEVNGDQYGNLYRSVYG